MTTRKYQIKKIKEELKNYTIRSLDKEARKENKKKQRAKEIVNRIKISD